MAVGILQKKNFLFLLESWQDSAVPPVQAPCFMSKDTEGGKKKRKENNKNHKGGLPGEGKRLEHK